MVLQIFPFNHLGESTTGTIYSFGYTLLVGVIANFIMGVFCTRIMLRSVAGFKFLVKNGCLEVLRMTDKLRQRQFQMPPTDEEFAEKYNRGHKIIDFVGHKKIFFGISLAIIIIGIVCNFIFGTQL